jgi:hypothetical protein
MKTSAKTWLRGDPDRPVPADDPERPDLLRRYVGPTHEPLWFYRIRGSCTPAEEVPEARGWARSAASVEQVRCDEENHPSSKADVTIEAGEAVFRMFTPRVYGLARVRFGR